MQLESQTCGLGFNLCSAGSRKMGFYALKALKERDLCILGLELEAEGRIQVVPRSL